MATVRGDKELWKTLNSKKESFSSPKDAHDKPLDTLGILPYSNQLVQPALDEIASDDDIPEMDLDASDEEISSMDSPLMGTETSCSECIASFSTPEELADHEKVHSTESNYICEECGEGFGVQKALNAHLSVHKVEKKFECDTCHKKFDYRDNLLFHMRIHVKKQTFSCEVCNQKFVSKELRDRHSMKHVVSVQDKNNKNRVLLLPLGKGKPGQGSAPTLPLAEVFTCDMCNKRYADKVSLENHKIVHIKHVRGPRLLIRKRQKPNLADKCHSCPECNERFKDRALFLVHLASCPKMKFHKCPKCGGRFHHQNTFKAHIAKCDRVINQSVPCEFCKKVYEIPRDPKQDGSQPSKFICEPCCTQLAQKSQVSGFAPRLENRFICNKCEKCFGTEDALQEHFKTHAADYYYACRKCNEHKYYLTKKALDAHLATHKASDNESPTNPKISSYSVGKVGKTSLVQTSKMSKRSVTSSTSNKSRVKEHARSPENKFYPSSRPDKRPRLGNELEIGEIVQVKSEPGFDGDESGSSGSIRSGGSSRSHLYYSEDTSDAGLDGTFSLVRGNSSDEGSDDEDMVELDVFIKKEITEVEDDLDDTFGSCTVFNPVRLKDSQGTSLNMPYKVIKQEGVVIKQDPDSVDTTVIKQEPLDEEEEELTIKDETDFFNRQIEDENEKSAFQENLGFAFLGNTRVKEEPDS